MATEITRPLFPQKAVVTAGMPYGNKGLHFGHIGGVFVPADMFARFLRNRIGADNVIFVCGTDCYGSPIDEGYRRAKEAGLCTGSIADYVKANHDAQAQTLHDYEISLDMFEGSGLGVCKAYHEELTREVIETLYENGFLEKRATAQFYDETAGCFLNGRQVVGRCPVQGCKSEKAYADECDLGHQYPPEDLIAPRSTISGNTPAMRPVANWYFKLPEFAGILREHVALLKADEYTRAVVTNTIAEFLIPPVLYIKSELEDAYSGISGTLPPHVFHAPEKGKASFELEFHDITARDIARTQLGEAGIRYRAGKALVPFRITGNITWGVPAPQLEGEEPLTVWCWPESLWAPISFTRAYLKEIAHKDIDEWKSYWCSDDATVYQFIGQDNIYFYGVAQPALFSALQTGHEPTAEGTGQELRQAKLIANYHLLFMNKKASSSGDIKPPLASELLEYYTAEQLRAHFLALGLGIKSVSFQPKPYDPALTAPDANPEQIKRMADPVLKEGALLTNTLNRFVRGCFYTAQKHNGGLLPLGCADAALVADAHETIIEYENAMAHAEFHRVMALMERFVRQTSKYWNDRNKFADALEDEAEAHAYYIETLINAFYLLRIITVLMEPIAPGGCRSIIEYLGIEHADEFLSWDHIFVSDFAPFVTPEDLARRSHHLKELPPRTDFFPKHPSQYE
jgi:methionyl-tRNA synthetase